MEYQLEEFNQDPDFPFFVQYGWHNQDLAPHRHADFVELVLVLGGSALHRVAEDLQPLVKGDVFVVAGDTSHGFEQPRELSLCNIMFRPVFLKEAAPELQQLPGYQALFVLEPLLCRTQGYRARLRLDAPRQQSVEALLGRMVDEYRRGMPGYKPLVRGLFLQLVVSLCRWHQKQPLGLGPGTSLDLPGPAGQEALGLVRAVAYMETNCHRPLALKEIAGQANLSARHFGRLFHQSHGTSPHRYLTGLRVARACRLLLDDPARSISQVALACGFADSGHFSRQFNQALGMSPRDYRQARLIRPRDIPGSPAPRQAPRPGVLGPDGLPG